MTDTNYKKEFIDFLIESDALLFGEFMTKSGRKSPYFVNTGKFQTGNQIKKLGEFYARNIIEHMVKGDIDKDIKFLFGPAYKGIPLVIATSIALCDYGMDINYCFNRKEEKDHGEGGNLVGYLPKPGDKALIIEDVITAGTAVREILPVLQELKVDIKGLVVSVDRMEKSNDGITAIQSLYKKEGIPTYPVINLNDIIDELYHPDHNDKKIDNDDNTQSVITEDIYKKLREYMKQYCIA